METVLGVEFVRNANERSAPSLRNSVIYNDQVVFVVHSNGVVPLQCHNGVTDKMFGK